MYLATLYVTLDLEPEVTSSDRERLLRALRDRLKHAWSGRITTRTDEESAIAVAFFDEGYERAKARLDEVLNAIEAAGEARIATDEAQIFSWYDGAFQEVTEDHDRSENGSGNERTVVYANEDEEVFSPIPSRFKRKLKISTRK